MNTQAFRVPFLPMVITSVMVAGCSSTVDPIASNISYGPDDQFANRVLDNAEQRQVLEIMQGAVTGPTDDPARPAEHGVRWEDVTNAAIKACSTLDLAVLSVSTEEDDRLMRIQIISVGNKPYELVVRRLPPPRIYEATATAGLFNDQTKLADRLLKAFGESMRAFGAKPGWPKLPNE